MAINIIFSKMSECDFIAIIYHKMPVSSNLPTTICDPGPKNHLGIFSNSLQYIVWVKIINVYFFFKNQY